MLYNLVPSPAGLTAGEGVLNPGNSLDRELENLTLGCRPAGLRYDENSSLKSEGYVLTVSPGGISLEYPDDRGCYYGLATLRQMVGQAGAGDGLPCCVIRDEPVFPVRAVMLDISRNRVPKLSLLKETAGRLAELKFNQLQLYTEHTFAYTHHEEVWRDASPVTAAEIRDLDLFCRERGMELVPNQNSFGHMERWLKHPRYHGIAEAPEGFEDPWGVYRPDSSTLDPSNPLTMEFLKGLYDEVLPNFSSRQFNIGCDETFDLGKGRSRERADREGTGRIYVDFIKELYEEVSCRGYGVQFWADIILHHPELVEELPEDMIAVNWGYEADHPFEKETGILRDADRPFYVCTGTSSWNSLGGRWDLALENIRSGAYWAERNGASGFMVTDWGDNGHWQQPVVSWPGFLMAAAAGWGGAEALDRVDWEKALSHLVFRDATGKAAAALHLLASIYKENPVKLHNGSIFFYLLQDPVYPYYRDSYETCRRAGIGRARETAAEAARLLEEARLPEGGTLREELTVTLRACELGIELASALFEIPHGDWKLLDAERKGLLKRRIESFLPLYEAAWSRTSRPGGLKESGDRLRAWLPRLE